MKKKIKLLTVIGARPQIIKAAALSRAIKKIISPISFRKSSCIPASIMMIICRRCFFDELGIPQPDYNLSVGSASHGVQTARMIEGIEKNPNRRKTGLPSALRRHQFYAGGCCCCFQNTCSHSTYRSWSAVVQQIYARRNQPHIVRSQRYFAFFSPTKTGFDNLLKEGFKADNKAPPFHVDKPGIYHCGDVMYDNSKYFAEMAMKNSTLLKDLGLEKSPFILCTIHRNANTDEPKRLQQIFEALLEIVSMSGQTLVLPLHPRTSKLLKTNLQEETYQEIVNHENIKLIPPVSFLAMIALEKQSTMIITDSGGVQKEAYFFQKPCIIMRPETEWKEIVAVGAAVIADASKEKIVRTWKAFHENPPANYPEIFGDGDAASFICGGEMLKNWV